MPTTLELANQILQELGYRTKTALSLFQTREELDILRELKNINADVVLDIKFNARKRYMSLTVDANDTEVVNTINGEIILEDGGIIDLTNKIKYIFNPAHQEFYLGTTAENEYSVFADNLLFTPNSASRTLNVYYYTFDAAKDSEGKDKENLSAESDTSIIPEQLQYKILVNGVCYKLKKRSNNARVPFWLSEYTDGRNQLRTYSLSEDCEAKLIIGSEQYSFVRNVG